MKRLIVIFILLMIFPSLGKSQYVRQTNSTSAPSGGCAVNSQWVNTTGTGIFYFCDNGTYRAIPALSSPITVGQGGTGTATQFTQGSVIFAGASGVYSQDPASLFFDDTNNRLGVGTATPGVKLDILAPNAAQVTGLRIATDTGGFNVNDLACLDFGSFTTFQSVRLCGHVENIGTGASGAYLYTAAGTTYNASPALALDSTNAAVFASSVAIGAGTAITKHLSATGTLNFASQIGVGCENLTITVTGAAVGDTVDIGIPNGSVVTNGVFYGWVSATDTVSIKFCAVVSGDPASGTFRADVWKH